MCPAKTNQVTISLDAMGGDGAPDSVLRGADLACKLYKGTKFLIFGNERDVAPILNELPDLKKISTLIHTEKVITNDDKPSAALRQGRDSSMGLAIKSVYDQKSDAAVSAGNTGALMAMSKFMLRTLPGIDRPAIATAYPTMKGRCVVLDLGANVDCNAENLFQFAIMGDAFARAVLGFARPSIGLLNIGTEEVKGNEAVRTAAAMLKDSELHLNYYGNVEGDDITKGTVDVVVTDGFSGNISLKTAEGTAQMCAHFLKMAFKSSIMSKLGYILARPALKKIFNTLDPRQHNGAMFLGLNGIVVKSHGGTDEIGFANAIGVAVELVTHKINQQITQELETHYHHALNSLSGKNSGTVEV